MTDSTELLPLDPPGTILREEYLEPMELSQKEVARATGIPYTRFNEIIRGERRISAEYSLRLGRYFGQHPQFWIGLQIDTDVRRAERERGAQIMAEVSPLAVA